MFGYDWIVVGGAEPFYERSSTWRRPRNKAGRWAARVVGCFWRGTGRQLERQVRPEVALDTRGRRVCDLVRRDGHGRHLVRIQPVANCRRGGHRVGLKSFAHVHRRVGPCRGPRETRLCQPIDDRSRGPLAQSANYAIAQYGMRLDQDAVATHRARHGTALDASAVAKELEWQMPREKRAATVERFVELAERRSSRLDQEAVAQIVAEMNQRRGKDDKNIEVDPLAVELAGRKLVSWNVASGWSWMFTVTALPAIVFFTLMFFVPESPRWLAKNGKPDRARAILRASAARPRRPGTGQHRGDPAGEIQRVNFRDLLEPRMTKVLILGAAWPSRNSGAGST